jgi:hypothetical protein
MPLTCCQRSMTVGSRRRKFKEVDYKPLHHAGNCNEYHANTDQYVCSFARLYFPLSLLGAPGPFLQADISLRSGPLKTIVAVHINSVRMLISNSLLYASPKVALRELQVNVWVIRHSIFELVEFTTRLCGWIPQDVHNGYPAGAGSISPLHWSTEVLPRARR